MSSFVPLNVEIEEESEDEIDDSKEIQIEEALKLYQNALKLHSQGPAFYDEAAAAYNELFRSEIFTYPESFSETQRIELYDGTEESWDDTDGAVTSPVIIPTTSTDGAPSTLPQILYLAYKNRGQFVLDRLKHQISYLKQANQSDDVSGKESSAAVSSSLTLLVEALDRDDTDSELWRKVSRIGNFLGSQRIARFCLEAVLDTDAGDVNTWIEPLGLEEGFAIECLKPLVQSLEDQLSESQFLAISEWQNPIIPSLKKNIDPCPYLPTTSLALTFRQSITSAKEQIIKVPLRTWASCGEAILHQISQETQGAIDPDPGAKYCLALPSKNSAGFQLPLAKTFTNGGITSGQNQPTLGSRPNLIEAAPISVDKLVTGRNWPGQAEASQLSTTNMDVKLIEQAIESPITVDHTETPDHGLNIQETGGIIEPMSLPTRKRSSEAAELPESAEGGRSRSKRIKARGSIDADSAKDSTAEDWARWFGQQLQMYHQADEKVFDSIGDILIKLGSKTSTDLQSLREVVSPRSSTSETSPIKLTATPTNVAASDLKHALDGWDLGRCKAFLNGHDSKAPAGALGDAQSPSFTAFLEHSNQVAQRSSHLPLLSGDAGMERFVEEVGKGWMSLGQLSFSWIKELLGAGSWPGEQCDSECPYEAFLWPDALKQSVVQILVNQDEAIYSELEAMVDGVNASHPTLEQHDKSKNECTLLAQVIFELHLDIYGRITNPSSIVDTATRLQQRDRLGRWAAFSSRLVNEWSPYNPSATTLVQSLDLQDQLAIRFMWASVVCNSLLEPDARDGTVLCFQHLSRMLNVLENRVFKSERLVVELPNNAIMPEISISAAQKEISRLTTMDFFMGIFSSENNDSLTIIESLEPLLELSVKDEKSGLNSMPNAGISAHAATGTTGHVPPSSKLVEALQFLEQGSLSLKLFLWQKLRDAYRAINYPPQVLSCDLRIVALIVNHLSSSSYTESAIDSRSDSLLRWLHRLDGHISRILSMASSNEQPFQCVDGEHIRTSLEAVGNLQSLLHVFALWEDTIRVGQIPPPAQPNQTAANGLIRSTDKFRDMIVKTWTLQYALLKEATVQNKEIFPRRDEDLISLLERMHHSLGLRCYCSLANKSFLKLMKAELEKDPHSVSWETNMSQLIFDLYGVKISLNATEMQDHGCVPEDLDRCTALEIMDLVMLQVNRFSIKDLLKCDLKFTVDKMQAVIRIPKIGNDSARTFNSRLVNNYLRSAINPLDLYRSLRGIGGLCSCPVHSEGSDIAAKGWYFLLGQCALTKFRSQKRTAAGSKDDLEIARTFLRHDLEFDTERWETWYRSAQVYDTLTEEDATWTAEKLDNPMSDLAAQQRKAIHCYSMAVAIATRSADPSFEDTSKMADLYADFGTRIYASTREPFSMTAFDLDDYRRPYNSKNIGMYKGAPFTSLQIYSAWKLASTLLRRASAQKPQNWLISFTLGKVLWKMYGYGQDMEGAFKRIGYQPVIDTFVRAIETCPEKRDSRHPEKDPILEPHYKLVSVVHKLVQRQRIPADEGCRILKATPYSHKVEDVENYADWKTYILKVLKVLRSADKANWHHRMVARVAHIIFDDDPNEPQAIISARHELSQSIFTKTMAIQVWKPDNERAGRHFVYTGRYVRFFTRLLYQLNDKTSLDLLARRIRKRTGDFLNHAGVWEEVCRAYLKLLRHQPECNIPEGYAEHKFQGMDPEVYQNNATRLEVWLQAQPANPPSIDILREALELQKLNNKLFKSNLFEDLIRDVYAHLYDSVIPNLDAREQAEEKHIRMRVDNILANPTPTMQTPPPDPPNSQGEQHRSKAKWVTNREIVRKAEAITALRATTVAAKPLKALAPAPSEQAKAAGSTPNLAALINADADKDAGSSVPGSVHDSADDESELSEVDEAVTDDKPETFAEGRPPLFPNLVRVGGGTADDPQEIEDDTGVEANGKAEDEEVEMRRNGETKVEPQVKESGVHEGNW